MKKEEAVMAALLGEYCSVRCDLCCVFVAFLQTYTCR
jgi:hypothetical protein